MNAINYTHQKGIAEGEELAIAEGKELTIAEGEAKRNKELALRMRSMG